MLEGRLLTSRLVDVVSNSGDARAEAVTALADIAAQVRSFLIWRTIINLGAAAVFGAIYQVCGLSHPWTWALLTVVLLYVPYLGTFLASIPPLLDAFITVDSPWVTVGLLAFYVAFVTVEGYIIVPMVMGRSMDLNATTVLLTTVYWHLLWGGSRPVPVDAPHGDGQGRLRPRPRLEAVGAPHGDGRIGGLGEEVTG